MIGFLLLLNAAPTLAFAAGCVVLSGLMQGAEADVLAYFISRLFGLRAYNAIYGVFFTISILGSAIGIFGYGKLYDLTRNYDLALLISGGALGLAAGCMSSCRVCARRPDNAKYIPSSATFREFAPQTSFMVAFHAKFRSKQRRSENRVPEPSHRCPHARDLPRGRGPARQGADFARKRTWAGAY